MIYLLIIHQINPVNVLCNFLLLFLFVWLDGSMEETFQGFHVTPFASNPSICTITIVSHKFQWGLTWVVCVWLMYDCERVMGVMFVFKCCKIWMDQWKKQSAGLGSIQLNVTPTHWMCIRRVYMGCVFLFAVEILVSDIMESLCVIIRKEEQISVLVKTDRKGVKIRKFKHITLV